jgi:hypothetical protein
MSVPLNHDHSLGELVNRSRGHKPELPPGHGPHSTHRGKIPVSVNARKDSIEIHHLMPISELQGLMVSNHPKRDYAALMLMDKGKRRDFLQIISRVLIKVDRR